MTPSDFAALQESHADLKTQVGNLSIDLAANTEATNRVETNTAELMGWLRALEGAFKVLNMVGRVAKPLSYIVGFIGAAVSAWYAFIHKSP
jgi:hypothetical protein